MTREAAGGAAGGRRAARVGALRPRVTPTGGALDPGGSPAAPAAAHGAALSQPPRPPPAARRRAAPRPGRSPRGCGLRARSALLIALTSGLLSLGFGLHGAAPWPLLLAIGCLYGWLQGADSSIYSTAVAELAPPDKLGSAQACQAVIGFSATLLAPMAAGLALDLGLGWPGVFALAGVVGLALALPLMRDA